MQVCLKSLELRYKFYVSKTDDGKSIRAWIDADTNWQQVKLENREALLAQYRRAEPIRLWIYENGRTQRSVKPLDGSSIKVARLKTRQILLRNWALEMR